MINEEVFLRAMERVPTFARKVAPCYLALKWEWGSSDNDDMRIPGAGEIERELYKLLRRLREAGGDTEISAGGLVVRHDEESGKLGDFSIQFSFEVTDEVYGYGEEEGGGLQPKAASSQPLQGGLDE